MLRTLKWADWMNIWPNWNCMSHKLNWTRVLWLNNVFSALRLLWLCERIPFMPLVTGLTTFL